MADIINQKPLKENSTWKVKIYTLSNPITGDVRYIGKTIHKLSERLNGHIKEATKNKNNSYKNNWINSLLKAGIQPIISLIDEVEENNWQLIEEYWISQFKTWGFKLTNLTDGGDGIKSKEHQDKIIKKIKYKLSLIESPAKRPEVRKKISEALKGRIVSDEWRKNMSRAGKGKKMPDSMKQKRKDIMKGNTITKDYYSKLSKKDKELIIKKRIDKLKEKYKSGELIHPMKGKTHSTETKEKLSKARKGKPTWSKKVKEINLETNETKIWSSANEANRFYFGKTSDYIASIIRKKKTYNNSIFEYLI